MSIIGHPYSICQVATIRRSTRFRAGRRFRVHEREADMRKLSTEETVLLQSVKVPASIDAAIRAAAERQGITVSRATRDALALYLSHPLTKGGNAEPTPKRRARAQS